MISSGDEDLKSKAKETLQISSSFAEERAISAEQTTRNMEVIEPKLSQFVLPVLSESRRQEYGEYHFKALKSDCLLFWTKLGANILDPGY
jgi:hypothetical protein